MNGYKQTEIGVIPEDWEVKELGEIINYVKGYPFKSKDYISDGVRIIRISDTTQNSIKEFGGIYISIEKAKGLEKWRLNEGDLIISTVGSKPPMYDSMVGKVIYVKKKFEGSLLNQNSVMLKNENNNLQKILSNHFNTKRYLNFIETIYRGNANQASINLSELYSFQIPLPPLPEQEAIAAALSDCDAWIESIEQLLAKKRLLKQGAMQELLTPKDGWEVKKLGEVCDVIGGGTPSTFHKEYWNGNINWFTPTEVGKVKYLHESNRKISTLGLKDSSATILPINTILLTTRAGIGDLGILKIEAATNQGFQSLVCKSVNYQFLYYMMQTKKNDLLSNASGSTFLEISPNKVKSLEIPFPSLSEQSRIATILSDMDTEIESLEAQLTKARQIKQGMMQELLTGKIRLVVND